ncbi:S-adenosyl-L-methionine-dependent methyltransferase [Polychaeton citri CBS 116435]|uniref:S-adenosyl-L-methionine-dependent methyltransferase n=1 Tax=Polychaeton citri CBS 116435 TaxID=1314669 RepID=A0A9P4UN86_9PEZI|nr:S-adenosyl-L-methionine-dependent methyltransferase [Polychaeton citri CBS 116435]
MALYHEAAEVINTAAQSGESIKATVFSKKSWKSDAKTLVALSIEAGRWSEILSEVIEKSELLKVEKQLTPALGLVLLHDFLLSKKGIVLSESHGLHAAIRRHRARLQAELTKERLRRGFQSVDVLRDHLKGQTKDIAGAQSERRVRWVRVNVLKTSLLDQLQSTFSKHRKVPSLSDLWKCDSLSASKPIYVDDNIPNLLALQLDDAAAFSQAYRDGDIILQDKASCFPAYLLDPNLDSGDVIDACAAPGNKTTHLAAIMAERSVGHASISNHVFACEKDVVRSHTLKQMCQKAGALSVVRVLGKQDFTKLRPNDRKFSKVTGLLLDPSCSGSGIVGREKDVFLLKLPRSGTIVNNNLTSRGTKRKRNGQGQTGHSQQDIGTIEEVPLDAYGDGVALQKRLDNLAEFQLRILKHAMSFAAANRITYSTCSVHATENEDVVIRALRSDVAKRRGWRVLLRQDQVEGLRKWSRRGELQACEAAEERYGNRSDHSRLQERSEIADACLRCTKGSGEGTMGFFLCGFVRDGQNVDATTSSTEEESSSSTDQPAVEDEWDGFSDETDQET